MESRIANPSASRGLIAPAAAGGVASGVVMLPEKALYRRR